MQTVNFTCGHCGNLMAVIREHLGQQVRCPHCQQVVVAPPPEGMGPPPGGLPETQPIVPPPVQPQSAFGSDLPRVEIAPEPAPPPILWPNLELSALSEPQLVLPPAPSGEPALSPAEPESAIPTVLPAESGQPGPDPGLAATGEWPGAAAETSAEPAADPALTTLAPRTPRRSGGSGWTIPLLIIPLISYAILATIAVIILYMRLQQQHHPLEYVPDVDGENQGARRQQSLRREIEKPKADDPLPSHLHVALGSTIRIGDLEVTPRSLELRRIWIRRAGYDPDEIPEQALVLRLQLRNVSTGVVFKPMDPCFDRRWKEQKSAGRAPFTYLELQGGRRFYGGPIRWAPPGVKDPPPRETVFFKDGDQVVAQNYNQELGPGQEMTTFVCTDPEDHAAQALENYHGPLLWRVRVRRGLVQVGERELSATAVIGVDFTDQDIRKQG